MLRNRKAVIARQIIKKRKMEGNTEMKELAKRFIDKECLITAFDSNHVWISDEEKIISFHQEDGYREKVLNTQEDFITFLLAHGSSGYRFQ